MGSMEINLRPEPEECAGPECEETMSRMMGSKDYHLCLSEYVPDGREDTGGKEYFCSVECMTLWMEEGLDGGQ